MFKNVFYDTHESVVHLWYDNKYRSEYWVPYVFKECDEETGIKSIDGKNCIKISFNSFQEYKTYQDENENLYENHVKPEIQYLVEKYYHLIDDEIIPPELKIYSLDIEVNVENNIGTFPSPVTAEEPITVITLYDFNKDKFFVFGLHPYITSDERVVYFNCKTEENLLRKFFDFTYKNPPDVYTGWNIYKNSKVNVSGFDFHYIINRTKKLFKEKLYLGLSPIKKVKVWEQKDGMSIDIAGVSILDYQAMYKWFSSERPERYTLNYIANIELKEQKLEYEGTLSDLYKLDWQRYVDYNIQDTLLIANLDKKLGYINLVQGLSILTRCPMEIYYSMTQMLDGKLLKHYRENNLCAPNFKGGTQETYPGGYVKSPNPVGLHDWIMSLDIASSYPTHIIALNMSLETYIGKITLLSEDQIYSGIINGFSPFRFWNKKGKLVEITDESLSNFNKLIKNKKISIAPCGTVFKNGQEGVIAHIERSMFTKRKDIKKQMKNESNKNEYKRKHTFQWALKILLNSMYGITAVPYSRYFNTHISEAITSCAKHTIQQGEKFVNEIFNSPNDRLQNLLMELKK